MTPPSIPLSTIDGQKLFGSENSDLEDAELFESYSVDKSAFGDIYKPDRKIGLLCAYKGCGKSAVLRLISNRLKNSESSVVVKIAAQDYSPDVDSSDPVAWMRGWRKVLLQQVASEVGASIKFAYTDDATHLVEIADKYGFRNANIVGYITKRAADKLQVSRVPELIDEAINKRIGRYLDGAVTQVWLLVDDVDLNFRNDSKIKAKIVGFLNAVKSLSVQIPDLRIRSTIRPNIWSILAEEYDSINQLKEFRINLEWTEQDIKDLLRKRISSYYDRCGVEVQLAGGDKGRAWIKHLFEDPMVWGRVPRPPHVVLDTLSRNRPRWLVELCKLSLATAQKQAHLYINLKDIELNLPGFGSARIVDTVVEYSAECPQLNALLSCFRGREKTWSPSDLEAFVSNSILQLLPVTIHGVVGRATARDVVKFLYYIGFLSCRIDGENGSYEHKSFVDSPAFMSGNFAVKNIHTWEIHPVFVEGLGMNNFKPVSGAKLKLKGRV